MAALRLRWTRLALADLDQGYAYIADDQPSAAKRVIQRIEAGAVILLRHPLMGREGRIHGTRELIVTGTPFIIPYRCKEGVIDILAVIHGARRWPDGL
jgi:toxin ParE1/3/4